MTSGLPEMRASDEERERFAEVLREAVAEGRLDMEEFGQRLDAVYKARTQGELIPLIRDLPAAGMAPAAPLADPSAGTRRSWPARIGGAPTSKGAIAVWGGFGRRGTWTVGRKFTAVTLMGGGEIDLREANFEDRDIVIRCFVLMGGVSVVVPPGVEVDVRGFGLMGGFGDATTESADEVAPGAPRVRVTGFAMMGGVGVERRLTKAARQRLKEQRKQQKLARKTDREIGKGERKELG
ncbi:DUF1707 SHOCT-like domain-containing protein [Streptomyces sp. A5-4]|uniref:DUF1707 SHOCT-like domain-containing protein n=1 Tax=Streptomyces sp. A5-4 TaxID=3384771 RepID=UPI003DA9B494